MYMQIETMTMMFSINCVYGGKSFVEYVPPGKKKYVHCLVEIVVTRGVHQM